MIVSLKKAKINVFSLKKNSFKEASCEVKNKFDKTLTLALSVLFIYFFSIFAQHSVVIELLLHKCSTQLISDVKKMTLWLTFL